METLKQIFTWWNSQTLGTRIYTWRKGQFVGSDECGNSFYECDNSSRRWVVFKKDMDASVVTSEWHGWLHHTFDEAPTKTAHSRKIWEKPHVENRTGSSLAYHPLANRHDSSIKSQDYEAWSPYDE
jgi:NADH:ubiquinone oxidoreductase subunit